MAQLFRPKIVEYRLGGKSRTPDGQRVTRDTPGAQRSERQAKKWYGRLPGQDRPVPLSASKETARRMLNKLLGDAEMASVGLVDPFAEQKAQPLAQHVADYGRYLKAKGDTQEHADRAVSRCTAVLEGIQADALGDLQPSAVVEFLASLRGPAREVVPLDPAKEWYTKKELIAVLGVNRGSVARMLTRKNLQGQGKGRARRYAREVLLALQEALCRGRGVATTNHYLTAVKGFTRWLVRDRRAPFDPLACLSVQNARADVRVERRTLTPEEFARLLAVARQGKKMRGLTGPEREVLYLLAARSGLRASELASLTPASFDFEDLTVTVQAAYSKHRRKDIQPLPRDVALVVRRLAEGKRRDEPLFAGGWPAVGADLLRLDLTAAGIPYLDEEGRVYDFHALRHQFITDLIEAGTHPKDAQVLARHSTISLTLDRYTHVRPSNLRAALEGLPPLTDEGQPQEKERRRA
ncbi:MAG: tyrosine-type recombinase/integrase [Gemmataceae bacterium]|nr:tyrosine-type recombinase/integrase [Gemmataceae bacterium]